ncbi:MAG: hypothetical protein HZY73_00165 [Micropruina sp.]|nr:MAG: hypothetical protein HZY73_00165 [Micropruina sp.]
MVGLQEAYAPSGQYISLRDALNATGKAYEISDLTPGASNGTRIMYNTATVTPLEKGAFAYANQVSDKTARYLVWATFRHNASGKGSSSSAPTSARTALMSRFWNGRN